MGQVKSAVMNVNTNRYGSDFNTDRLGKEVRVGDGRAMGRFSPRKAAGRQAEYSFNADRSEMVTGKWTCEVGRWTKWLSMPSTTATSSSGWLSVVTGFGYQRAKVRRNNTRHR